MMGQQIHAVADFGAFPGSDVAIVVVSTNGSFLTTSDVQAEINPDESLSDVHSEDELVMLKNFIGCSVPQSLKVAATGFSVTVTSPHGFMFGKIPLITVWR